MVLGKSQIQKATYCMILSIVQNRQTHRDSKVMSDCQGWGRRESGLTAGRFGVSVRGVINAQELDSGDDFTT